MPFLYILESQNNHSFYIGSTNNLNRRISEHRRGKSKYIRKILPFKLVFFQEFNSKSEATKAEKWLKRQKDRSLIKRIIDDQVLSHKW